MSATAEHCRAGLLQARLLAAVDARPVLRRLPPSPRGRMRPMMEGGGARLSELRLTDAVDGPVVADVASILRSAEVIALPMRLRRELVHRIALCRAHPEAVAALVALFLADLDQRPRVELDALLEASLQLLEVPVLLGALPGLLETAGYRGLPPALRARVVRCFVGPRATDLTDPDHQAVLTTWWLSRARELWLALAQPLGPDTTAEEVWRAHLYEPCRPLFLLSSAAKPGLFVVCFGTPDDPRALSYGRTVFLDDDQRLRAMLRGPDRRIQERWSDEVDPGHPRYEMRRTMITRDEELALVRWLLEGHLVSSRRPYEPPVFPRAAYDALLELDTRLPTVLAGLGSNRGEPVFDRGVVVAGRVVESEADADMAFFRAGVAQA